MVALSAPGGGSRKKIQVHYDDVGSCSKCEVTFQVVRERGWIDLCHVSNMLAIHEQDCNGLPNRAGKHVRITPPVPLFNEEA